MQRASPIFDMFSHLYANIYNIYFIVSLSINNLEHILDVKTPYNVFSNNLQISVYITVTLVIVLLFQHEHCHQQDRYMYGSVQSMTQLYCWDFMYPLHSPPKKL